MMGTSNIAELAKDIEEVLEKHNVQEGKLSIKMNQVAFMKLDEDLFYRLNPKNPNEKFTPSESEINITFNSVTIQVTKT